MTRFSIGAPVRRVEDVRFLTGAGRFVADECPPGLAHGVLLTSPHAHARIVAMDVSRAWAAPGVLAVLTGADVAAEGLGGLPPLFMPEDMGGPPGFRTRRPILSDAVVRGVGDRVAFVVAETERQARDAAECIEVDYEPLPATIDLAAAVGPEATPVWQGCSGNVAFTLGWGDAAATEASFTRAAHVVRIDVVQPRLSANPIETRGAVGSYDPGNGRYTLVTSSQNVHQARTALATHVFKVPVSQLRVIARDVGGGFGLKTNPFPEEALVLWAARRVGRPVRWIASRSESFLTDNHGRDQVVSGELALDAQGRVLAIRARALHGVGAYVFSSAVAPLQFSMLLLPNVYDMAVADVRTRAVFTHTAPLAAYRGAGRPEACYLVERLVDEAAARLGLDAAELRRRNFISAAAMPYRSATGITYDSGQFEAALDQCLEQIDWSGFERRRVLAQARGHLLGRGLACFIEQSGVFNERMSLHFQPDGSLTIVAGTLSHGQGHATVYAQMASSWLGIAFERIRLVQGDTDGVPIGRGTFAARSMLLGGSALRVAADRLVERARPMAARLLEAAVADVAFEEGCFRVVGTDRVTTLEAVARACHAPHGLGAGGLGLEASGSWEADPACFPNGCHACEVDIDPETGVVRIERYVAVDDAGRVINPLLCEGQIHGGIAQGIGQALLERIVHDPDSGQLLSGSFLDYAMPRADDLPAFVSELVEVPSTTNPIGVKGVGESGAIGAPAAVINALMDALRRRGVTHFDMPATPERVWRALATATGT